MQEVQEAGLVAVAVATAGQDFMLSLEMGGRRAGRRIAKVRVDIAPEEDGR